jgi:hypothetical protein
MLWLNSFFFVFVGLLSMASLCACDSTRFRVRTPPGPKVDVFQQTSASMVDILWVVDNSSSMADEQQALSENFSHFYEYLESNPIDYHIGVISTDVYNPNHAGRLLGEPAYIHPNTPDSASVFANNIKVGTLGKGDEQGFEAALAALSAPLNSSHNAGFVRSAAHLFIIFVSDEDDHSFGEVPYYLRTFEQIKGIGNDRMVNVSSVVETPEDACQEAEPGERYVQLAHDSGSLALSICGNFAKHLEALGLTALGLRRTFSLTQSALPSSVSVWVKTRCNETLFPPSLCDKHYDDCTDNSSLYGQTCVMRQSPADGWSYDETTASIRFNGQIIPPLAAVIEVGYTPFESL